MENRRTFVATVAGDQTLTLPAEVVAHLGLEDGERVIFEVDAEKPEKAEVRRLRRSYAGIMQGLFGTTNEEVLAYVYEERASWNEFDARTDPETPC
jgi:bifunctional DNA-binding transcriptional regulator/antitoxin component of YhaV-PrlF toxin-antitoxin module